MAKKYIIKFGSTLGDLEERKILVGYDWEDGEPVYEIEYYRSMGREPQEQIVGEYESYDLARKEFLRLDDQYRRTHPWPWNYGHFESIDGGFTIIYTDNDSEEWYTLQEIES